MFKVRNRQIRGNITYKKLPKPQRLQGPLPGTDARTASCCLRGSDEHWWLELRGVEAATFWCDATGGYGFVTCYFDRVLTVLFPNFCAIGNLWFHIFCCGSSMTELMSAIQAVKQGWTDSCHYNILHVVHKFGSPRLLDKYPFRGMIWLCFSVVLFRIEPSKKCVRFLFH